MKLMMTDYSINVRVIILTQVLICTGKVYYDLLKERRDRGLDDQIAIHTLEQICPFPFDIMKQVSCNIDKCFWRKINVLNCLLSL